jgi:uncharacterized membrane protein AbrB (regulator of aidB expression)
VAEDLDADSRMVAFMQHLRLILIVLTTPILVSIVFSPGSAHVPTHTQPGLGVSFAAAAAGYLFLLWTAPLGLALGKILRASMIRALVDEEHMTFTEVGELIGCLDRWLRACTAGPQAVARPPNAGTRTDPGRHRCAFGTSANACVLWPDP